MSSQTAADGKMVLTVTFKQGTDPDKAQIQVQNRVSRALPRLPEEVQRIGVVTEKTSPIFSWSSIRCHPTRIMIHVHCPNYALLNVRDELARLPGVGNIEIGGAGEYSMRVWIDPEKVAARGLTANDVVAAIREQNMQVAAGSVGQQPNTTSAYQVTVNTLGRLTTEEQFSEIVVKAGDTGQITRLKDVARIELGSDAYTMRALLDGKPTSALQIFMTPGANALDVSSEVRETMAELKKSFPDGVDYKIPYDPNIFVKASLKSVITTLLEAIALVVLVVILFLQTWRASIIPLIAVPVSLIGTFAIMYYFGFSLKYIDLIWTGTVDWYCGR